MLHRTPARTGASVTKQDEVELECRNVFESCGEVRADKGIVLENQSPFVSVFEKPRIDTLMGKRACELRIRQPTTSVSGCHRPVDPWLVFGWKTRPSIDTQNNLGFEAKVAEPAEKRSAPPFATGK